VALNGDDNRDLGYLLHYFLEYLSYLGELKVNNVRKLTFGDAITEVEDILRASNLIVKHLLLE